MKINRILIGIIFVFGISCGSDSTQLNHDQKTSNPDGILPIISLEEEFKKCYANCKKPTQGATHVCDVAAILSQMQAQKASRNRDACSEFLTAMTLSCTRQSCELKSDEAAKKRLANKCVEFHSAKQAAVCGI
ncbi:MAG: hypothetical protein V4534_02980 [Myxococcota bacterium]